MCFKHVFPFQSTFLLYWHLQQKILYAILLLLASLMLVCFCCWPVSSHRWTFSYKSVCFIPNISNFDFCWVIYFGYIPHSIFHSFVQSGMEKHNSHRIFGNSDQWSKFVWDQFVWFGMVWKFATNFWNQYLAMVNSYIPQEHSSNRWNPLAQK